MSLGLAAPQTVVGRMRSAHSHRCTIVHQQAHHGAVGRTSGQELRWPLEHVTKVDGGHHGCSSGPLPRSNLCLQHAHNAHPVGRGLFRTIVCPLHFVLPSTSTPAGPWPMRLGPPDSARAEYATPYIGGERILRAVAEAQDAVAHGPGRIIELGSCPSGSPRLLRQGPARPVRPHRCLPHEHAITLGGY
jgi:hypothetical protein